MSAPPATVTTVDLLRHGACEGGEIYRGKTDVVLSDAGWRQMEQAIAQDTPWQRVVTSPLLRCRAFAERCATRFAIPLQVVAALREVDFGDWEGRLHEEVWRTDAQRVSRYYADPTAETPPGGEPTVEALDRVATGWQQVLQDCAGQHVLVVAHGGVIRLLLSHLLAMPLSVSSRLHLPYASMSRIQVHRHEGTDFPVLMSLNAAAGQA